MKHSTIRKFFAAAALACLCLPVLQSCGGDDPAEDISSKPTTPTEPKSSLRCNDDDINDNHVIRGACWANTMTIRERFLGLPEDWDFTKIARQGIRLALTPKK